MTSKRAVIFDKTGGKCLYCGADLTGTRWQADHVYPIIRHPETKTCVNPEFDTIENMFPSCGPCNNFKSTFDIEGFRWRIKEQFDNVLKYSTGARQLFRMGLLTINKDPDFKFWFERNNIHVPGKFELLGVTELTWNQDHSEPDSYYTETSLGICTLRYISNFGWLAIHTMVDWEQNRTDYMRCSLEAAKLKTTAWLMK